MTAKNTQSKTGSAKPYLADAGQEIGELAKTAILAVLFALFIRTFFYEPFNIPSGSMKPTLLVGDYLFVSKQSYGLSRFSFPFGIAPIEGRLWEKDPKRGDIVVFKLPSDTGVDYIKRVVGLPGETIQVRYGRLYINGQEVPRDHQGIRQVEDELRGPVRMEEYRETLPGGVVHTIYEEGDNQPLDNTEVYVVPEGHYFMMGDNRDNSRDSRVMDEVGFVPFENFVGRADHVLFSTNGSASLFEIWKWPWAVRADRFFLDIAPTRLKQSGGDTGA